jgi:hypothetical protein
MTEKVQRYAEPFVNSFGDVIQPGDEVYAVTVSTSRTAVSKGKYIGVTKSSGWRGEEVKRVQLEVEAKRSYWYFKDTGERTTWNEYYYKQKDRDVGMGYEPYKRITTLQLNRIMPVGISADRLAESI